MKTNALARRLAKVRGTLVILVLLGLAAAEFGVGESLATRLGQLPAFQAEYPQAHPMGIAELMAAAP